MAIGTPTDLGHFSSISTPATGSITTAAAVSSGALIVLIRYANASTGLFTSAPTDSSSNTYVQAPSGVAVTNVAPVLDIWYCKNATSMASSSTISFNFSGSALREAVTAFTCTGLDTSNPLDPLATTVSNGTTVTAANTTSLNVRALYNSMLLIGCFTTATNTGTVTNLGSWTQVGGMIASSANIFPAYQVVSGLQNPGIAWAPQWTTSGLNRSQGFGFKGAGATFLGGGPGGAGLAMGVG